MKEIRRLLVANRGEIAIRVFRAATELKIRTIALYTFEDRYSLHRYKADESYQIGDKEEPLRPYLNIEEIIQLAKDKRVDAIHPGYGFLSENVDFVKRCEDEGIIFVGPTSQAMLALGDKVRAKEIAKKAGVPVIEDRQVSAASLPEAKAAALSLGFPLIVKAAAGGGGRGMRVVRKEEELDKALQEASREAKTAFGDDTIFLERFIESPKHLEVQLLGDTHGNLIHLYERDCSVQRRFQKVVEVAPAVSLSGSAREQLCEYALKIGREVQYKNAGTVEFLVTQEEEIFFIEVNPRIQVEHTVTEEVTGVDLVRSQILIAGGAKLSDPEIGIASQSEVACQGAAIQCRITTEDPENNFLPDYGRIITYRSPGGFGIRLDAGSAYSGMQISPFFDSLLVKVTASAQTLPRAAERLERALREFRVRGVKTNILFLINVIGHPLFREGKANVDFLSENPELFQYQPQRDRANKVLRYLAHVVVNGNPDVKRKIDKASLRVPRVPTGSRKEPIPSGTKQKLEELGREKFLDWVKSEKRLLITDTTFRDAHQSLLATRVRTIDMLRVAEPFARAHPKLFSLEVWGGATFDVALRFLHECPWERLRALRKAVPNILLQMLLRGSNAVGYTAYPDNLIKAFIVEAAESGIDIFRIFDSLNWVPAMEQSIQAVRENTGSLAEACICYTGHFLDSAEKRYTLQYYLELAKRLEDAGAHLIAIKDMAGLLRPEAAAVLIGRLKETVSLPIHLHTHDTSSIQSATYLRAVGEGVDIVDAALASLSGLTSQPNLNSLVAMLEGSERDTEIERSSLDRFSLYWEAVREAYAPFESGLKAGTAEVYRHEIPGGQYSNLRPQARALGLEEKFEQIKENYIAADRILGGLIKVTPSSKVVGDLALFMTSNGLSESEVLERAGQLSFPESVRGFLRGDLGQPHFGFPESFQRAVLKDEKPFTDRPNKHLEPIDRERELPEFQERYPLHSTFSDYLSYKLYPKVFDDFYHFFEQYGDVSLIPTPAFFYGIEVGEEVRVEIAPGKKLIVELSFVGEPNEEGERMVNFLLNGEPRSVLVKDQAAQVTKRINKKAEGENEVGSPLQGKVSKILKDAGDSVKVGEPLFLIEAMKMETTVTSPKTGSVQEVVLPEGSLVEQNDLVIILG